MADASVKRNDAAGRTITAQDTVGRGDDTEGMSYLDTRLRRLVTLYMPLALIVFVLS